MKGAAVTVTGVSKRLGRVVALDEVSFGAGPGVVGLLGPNGAGKTTLLRVLATVTSPDAGSIRLLGRDPTRAEHRLATRRRLGYLPQEPGFPPGFTAFEFVDYVAILKEWTRRRTRHDEVRRVLNLMQLDRVAQEKIRKLSGGMRRRLGLAQALIGDPELLILDEPTASLDPEQRLRCREVISVLASDCTVVLATHHTEDVNAVCNQVVVLHHGQVRFDGSTRGLAEIACGKVWQAPARDPAARLAWRTGEGEFRNLGEPPPGTHHVQPTTEDGYLLLVGAEGESAGGGG
jgi:ABC-2 type transport system ATP-binding protein